MEPWYRVYASLSSYGVYVERLPVLKETPQGVWLEIDKAPGKRFVLRDGRKRFACPTLDEAIQSFIARTTRRVQFMRRHTDDLERLLASVQQDASPLALTGALYIRMF